MSKYIDLHLHTSKSDGSLSPEGIVKLSAQYGLSAIAISDHDTMEGYYDAIGYAREHNIELIPAVELSCEEENKDIHVLGYFIDGSNAEFTRFLETFRMHRRERVYRITEKLQELGIDISGDEILCGLDDASPGRLHIARALVQKGIVANTPEAFRKYIGEQCPAYVKKMKLSVKECIDLIHKIGGIAVLAHPGVYLKDHLIHLFIQHGLDGLEVFHSEHSFSDTKKYKQMAQSYGLLITGGSDFHGPHEDNRPLGELKIPYSYLDDLKQFIIDRTVFAEDSWLLKKSQQA
ncbi:MAG: PHP domain-containing protein [Candidatus Auribacter fodinae]|jgi:predicted metal-dependent phosphoesterase TrpH|uniref:PHP domain-containing protein n=1 Tax=Candidatus Auribacter fodinae TaxID=2093366 RepID=A0A3A4R2F1_9BACT|nr:MAG: PHP domain-containing protein [Candidatus Auribacter fodinae]